MTHIGARISGWLSLAFVALLSAASGAQAAGPTFVGGPLPPAPGLGLSRNLDSEPGVAVAPDGTFWMAATTGLDQRRGTGSLLPIPPQDNPTYAFGNSDIWRSTDGGQTYQWVADPFGPVRGQMGLAGEDTDVTVATARNAAGLYNVYVASLWVAPVPDLVTTVGDIDLAISQDGGATWIVDKLAASVPLDDRPWLAADGACVVYLAYSGLEPTRATVVNKYDLCHLAETAKGATLTPVASSRYLELLPGFAQNKPDTYTEEGFGKILVDTSPSSPYRHRVYLPEMDCGPMTSTDTIARHNNDIHFCPDGVEVHMLVSADGGHSWYVKPIATGTTKTIAIWPVWAATDAAGTVYFVWWDERHVYLDVSKDGGDSWSAPKQIDEAPSNTSIIATVAAGKRGVVEIAWYGTDVSGTADDQAVMGKPGSPTGAPWRVYWTRSRNGGHTFKQVEATDVVHRGAECTHNSDCDLITGNRDLFDDFGLAISPVTGRTSIGYDSDQPEGDIFHLYTGYATEQP